MNDQACADIVKIVQWSLQGVPCKMAFAALKYVYPEMTWRQFNALTDTLIKAGKLKCVAAHLGTPNVRFKASNTKQWQAIWSNALAKMPRNKQGKGHWGARCFALGWPLYKLAL